jgi:hypothetical protein
VHRETAAGFNPERPSGVAVSCDQSSSSFASATSPAMMLVGVDAGVRERVDSSPAISIEDFIEAKSNSDRALRREGN